MFPDMAASISPSVGLGLAASNAVADMIWPDWQYPHCGTSSSIQACWIFLPAGVAPMASIVVMRLPAVAETGVMHERTGLPSRWIVHAPHKARPQPNFVPVIPSTSRSTQSNGVSSSTSTLRALPLIVSVCAICRSSRRRRAQDVAPPCEVYVIRFLLCINRHGTHLGAPMRAIDGFSHKRLALLSFPHASHTSSARDVAYISRLEPSLGA